jgi:hypothetical protein
MIKNIYYKCKNCDNIIIKYIDEKYKDNISIICHECNNNEFDIVDSNKLEINVKLKNNLKDYKALDKSKYMSNEYKDIKNEIKRVHIDKKGLLGDKRKYL